VRRALLGVRGVVDAEVWYDDKRADVEYDPETVEVAALVLAIDGAGFAGSLMAVQDDSDGGAGS
jgi:copper chaperone CopZ